MQVLGGGLQEVDFGCSFQTAVLISLGGRDGHRHGQGTQTVVCAAQGKLGFVSNELT